MAIASTIRDALGGAKEYLAQKEAGAAKYDPKMEALIPVIKKEIPLKAHAHRKDDIFTAIRLAKEMKHGSILINLSGRGDKDMDYILENYGIR